MKRILRTTIRRLLGVIGRDPRLKRFTVDLIYRVPALDIFLRNAVHEFAHDDAKMDMDIDHLPERTRQILDRIKAGTAP